MEAWLLDSIGYYKEKDADETLDYGHDWTEWLEATDGVSTSTWAADSGVTLSGASSASNITSTLIAGGTTGTRYTITNTVTCTSGRIVQRSFGILIKAK